MKKYILLFALLIAVTSCVTQPSEPVDNNTNYGKTGAFILCEGLWKMENSTLDRYDFSTGAITNDYFGNANSGMILGDLASDIVVIGNKTYITVSSAHTIIVMETSTGKYLGKIDYTDRGFPRKICLINDSIAYVTDQSRHSISKVNIKSMTILIDSIPVGPAPEGIAFYNNYLFVANSGFGDYMANVPKAGTVSVIDINSNIEIKSLTNLPNVVELSLNKKAGKLYVCYYNLPSLKDSLGGITEFDLSNLNETRRWKLDATAIILSATGDTLFFFNDNSLYSLNLNLQKSQPKLLVENPNKSELWYSLSYSAYDNSLWIGNAMNYQINGKLLIYKLNDLSSPKIVNTGINPNKIVFF